MKGDLQLVVELDRAERVVFRWRNSSCARLSRAALIVTNSFFACKNTFQNLRLLYEATKAQILMVGEHLARSASPVQFSEHTCRSSCAVTR